MNVECNDARQPVIGAARSCPGAKMTPMSAPGISVVVPSYRRPELLPRLVAALEAQTTPSERIEVIIVDNGSHDETAEVLEDLAHRSPLRVRPLSVDVNRGPAAARNLGWRSAVAPVIAFIDDDCVPDPRWVESGLRLLGADRRIGIVQGRTIQPSDQARTPWTVYRQVRQLSGLWEGCNLFVRREALEDSGGFDESIGWYGEDTALGWSVVEAGWEGAFEDDALVTHDQAERSVRWHMEQAFLEGNHIGLAKRFPGFHATFWRPWAYRRRNALFALAVVGLVFGVRRRTAMLLILPWAWVRRPPPPYRSFVRLLAERAAVDASGFAGMAVASIRHRRLVL